MPNTIRRRTTHAQVKAFWAEHDAGKRVSFVRNLNKVDWNNYRKNFLLAGVEKNRGSIRVVFDGANQNGLTDTPLSPSEGILIQKSLGPN